MYLEDFSVGQTFRSRTLRITALDIKRFASEFDPQPFHLDDAAARDSIFGGLVASGWHTTAITMKLMVTSNFSPAGGLIGVGVEEIRWPRPVRPDDELHVDAEVVESRTSKSNDAQGLVKVRMLTVNQNGETVQIFVANILVPRRPAESAAGAMFP